MHLLLLAMLLISPAFVSSKQEPELPTIYLIPSKLTDEPFSGGGSPQATAPPASAPKEITPPAPAPAPPSKPQTQIIPRREPDPPKPEPEKRPAKPQRNKNLREPAIKPERVEAPSKDTAATEKPPRKKPEITPTFNKATDSSKAADEAREREKAEASERAARSQYLQSLNKLRETLGKNLSHGTSIEMPGPGGEAYANYRQVVKSFYQNNWFPPDDLSSDSASVKAKVVILRDGTVKSAEIVEPSRIPSLDNSVRRALAPRFIAPFPEGAKDNERVFYIDFNLKTKRATG